MSRARLAGALATHLVAASALGAQAGDGRVSGSVNVSNELYAASGIDARRPGSTWRVQAAPSLRLFGATSIGVDLLLSNEGTEFRQRLPQLGLTPRFGWGTLYLGDFTRDYGATTLQGLRLRGAGIDAQRRWLRASVQGGTSQDALAATAAGPTFRRLVLAGSVGAGTPGQRSLDLTFVHARDERRPVGGPFVDTLGLDTLAADQRPQAFTRPQAGYAAEVAGTLALLQRALTLRGAVAGALLTRDRTSPRIDADSLDAGGAGFGGEALRLSSNGDLAWNAEAQYRGRRFGLGGAVEQVGAGYSSLGVAWLINDRRAWSGNGDVRLLGDRLQLQARVQRQEDNLLGQKRFTTTRDVVQAGAVARIRRGSLALTAVRNLAGNDASNDTLLVDNRAGVLAAQGSVPWRLLGRDLALTGGWSWQQNEDANPVRAIPAITVNTWNAGLVVPVGVVTLSPSMNGVTSSGGGVEPQRNVVGGFRASARLAGGKGTMGAGVNRTFVAARELTGMQAQLGWSLPWETRLTVSGRMNRFGAFGTRPAFRESYLTSSLGRSF